MLDGVTVSLSEQQLNGSQRVLLDGVISADQCRQLQRLSNVSPDPKLTADSQLG